jgi:zinc transport system substrate-binding protein
MAILCATLQTSFAQDAPRVVTDILPVHSLVSQVMEGVGAPDLLLAAGSDPHNHAMRPSQAALLENADVVVAIGPALTPWLEKPLTALASEATQIMLLDVEGTKLLDYRGGHAHDHGHDRDDDTDPHAWLDPSNAQVWVTAIAETLAETDPAHAAVYRANADASRNALIALEADWQTALKEVGRYGVHHDAYQYFEARFGLENAFVIREDDAHQPGPARIAELRAEIGKEPVACVFVEPFVNQGLVKTVLEGSDALILELDPIGVNFELGAGLFPQVLQEMANTFAQCR